MARQLGRDTAYVAAFDSRVSFHARGARCEHLSQFERRRECEGTVQHVREIVIGSKRATDTPPAASFFQNSNYRLPHGTSLSIPQFILLPPRKESKPFFASVIALQREMVYFCTQ